MRIHKQGFAVLLISTLLLPGCATRRDVTDDPAYQGGLQRDQVYRLKDPVALKKTDSLRHVNPRTIDLIRSGEEVPEVTTRSYKGIVERGARLQITKLEDYRLKGVDMVIFPYARILDGKYQGRIVGIIDLTTYFGNERAPNNGGMLRAANPEHLERVK